MSRTTLIPTFHRHTQKYSSQVFVCFKPHLLILKGLHFPNHSLANSGWEGKTFLQRRLPQWCRRGRGSRGPGLPSACEAGTRPLEVDLPLHAPVLTSRLVQRPGAERRRKRRNGRTNSLPDTVLYPTSHNKNCALYTFHEAPRIWRLPSSKMFRHHLPRLIFVEPALSHKTLSRSDISERPS